MILSIYTVSFGLASAMAAVCLLVFVVGSLPARQVTALIAAFSMTIIWSVVTMVDAGLQGVPTWWLAGLEAARYALWIVALFSASGVVLSKGARTLLWSVFGMIFSLALLLPLLGPAADIDWDASRLLIRSGLLLACLGLVMTEQFLRNSALAVRHGVKLCALGIGGQFTYDLFMYSQAELLGALNPTAWALRGLVVALLMPIAATGFFRMARDEPAVFVSRQVIFYTTAFLALGGYLFVMALGGYYVSAHGGTWGESLQLLFFVGAALVLAMVLLSDTLWRRLRVFIAKHFYRNKYDYRVEWLRFVRTLSFTQRGEVKHAAIRAVSQILQSPGGVLFLLSESAQAFEPAAQWNDSDAAIEFPPALSIDCELVGLIKSRHWVIDLQEYQRHPGVYRNIVIPEWLFDVRLSWRILTPLLDADQLVGLLVLRAPPPPFQMTFEDRDLMQMAGRHIAVLIAQQIADQHLAESRQFDAFNRFAAFVMHDLKNSVAQLQLLVNNAAKHRGNPEFMDDAISTITNSVGRMTHLIGQLQSRSTESYVREVDLAQILQGVVTRGRARETDVQLRAGDVTDSVWVQADADKLAAVLDHVVRNAQEAAGRSGTVAAELSYAGSSVQIAICDDGPGMEAEFVRERLFKPFDSTKGSKGMGIGAYQTREYVRQLGGAVEVQSRPGSGTTFMITLPLCHKRNAGS